MVSEREELLEHITQLGQVEIRERSGDLDPIDAFTYLSEPEFDEEYIEGNFPADFTKKDKRTGFQQYFECLACSCQQGSVVSLIAHVKGASHKRKCNELKRVELGLPARPPQLPKEKKVKVDNSVPREEINRQPLSELLEDHPGCPALGLEYINEYTHPRNPREPRWYTCHLTDCKSAWGMAQDMLQHLIGSKVSKRNQVFSRGDRFLIAP